MGLTNAEKQAAYRARYAEYKQRVAELEAEVERLKASAPTASPDLAKKLEPLLEGIFVEGCKGAHDPTASPGTVMANVVRLERLLVEHGIAPESERSRDAIKYAAKIRRRLGKRMDDAFRASHERHAPRRHTASQ